MPDHGLVTSAMTGFSSIDAAPIDNLDSIDPEFQLVFRKMSKKDPTTKTKALQELIELVNKSEADVVCTILPFWPKFYCALAVDFELRVRECTQQAHSAITGKCGKSIAPILRQIAAIWIVTQFDTYAPAASLSSRSFRNAFPDKYGQVFRFCQKEIANYLVENLTVHTATTMSNPK